MLAIEWLETVRRRAADALAARSAKRRRLEAARQSLGDFLPHGHQAESLEQRLMLSDTATALIFAQPPAGALAGSTLPSIAVDVVDSSSQIVATDTSTITLALSAGTFNGGSNVVTANAVNGIATFASVAIAAAGSYTLAATDGMLTPAVSGSFNVYRFNPIASLLPPPNGANPYGDVVLDSNGNLFGTSNQGGTSNLGTVFEIVHGSSAIIAIASFNGANGSHPEAGLAIDTSGNFFGTTYQGGASGYGTVFEIAHGTTTVTTIAAFNGIDGANPTAAVTLDSGGDIFGTTPSHGANGFGTVFEIVRGATTLTTVASFTTLSGGVPEAPVILDSNGNLFGTTSSYGPSGLGTVFEIASGSDAITLTAAFTGSTGHNPYGAVTFDSSGNLFGTTNQGGTSNNGTVFEVAHGSSIVTTTARFVRNTSGALPYGGLTIDTSGNLFGTTSVGGTGGLGTVFEIAHGTTALIAIGSFSNGTGTNPQGGVTLDSSGNLFGAAQFGGTNSDGTVFEIAHGTTVINALASFTNPSAENPIAALAVDSSGDVFGATPSGGVNNDGSVFEIPNGSTNVTVIASFNGNNGNSPYGGVTLDSSGNIFGTTQSGGISGAGTVFEIVHGTNVINAIASFNTAGGYLSYGGISLDSSGDLFGATFLGGANSDGVVFEIVHGTSVITTVASFNGANGRNPLGGVTLDSSGDIFGTTEGATSMGTVFEIAHNTTTISTIASFNSTTGIDPDGGIALDSAGDLFGTTFSDGSGSYGTVFEIPHGTTAISTLASFNYDNGGYLYANVTLDSSGNIFGAAAVGGAAGDGLIFEIPFGTSAIETLLSFNGANGANPHATLTLDSSGNLFGDTQNGGANNTGAVFDLSIAPPPTLSFTMPPISTTAGGVLGGSNGVQVSVLLAGSVVTADSTTVILTLSGAVFSTGSNTASAAVVNGVATFNNLI
ncbi:MAG TPA: choice-of-anchor tandem repeat GloVer-containing protein, partial [Humisphaera sp.]|nr:choice-of-anchor tandem repeat GloVer-containing protein [Humisphaera sp.]